MLKLPVEPLPETRSAAIDAPAPQPEWQRLDPRSVYLNRAIGWIVFAVLMSVYSVVLAVMWAAVWLKDAAVPVWLTTVLTMMWPLLGALLAWLAHRFPELEYRYTTWRLDDVGLTIRTGVVWRKEISVARSRVQHIDVSQGPIERRYGLATLSVYTAGTDYSRVDLDGLEHRIAVAARDALLPPSEVDAV